VLIWQTLNEAAIWRPRNKNHRHGRIIFQIGVMLGPERKSRVLTENEKKITAYHEAGHALVAHFLSKTDLVHKISIIARGQAGGYTLKLPSEERHLRNKKEFIEEIAVLLAGQITEKEVFGDVTTGATPTCAYRPPASHRFRHERQSRSRTYGEKEEMIFLGREIHEQRDYSEKVAEQIDKEISAFIDKAAHLAIGIIKSRQVELEKVVKVLMEKETIEKEEFEALVGKKEAPEHIS
jgi:cell division protease FtsH